MKAWLALGIVVARAAAAAPDPARCEAGARFAEHGDLPRAALYLDGCDDLPAYARTARDVRRKLEHSALSTLDIETTPPGLVAEVDALPGEHVTTPATVWVRAGRHVVHVAREGGPPLVATVDVAPHAHAAVVLEVPKPPPPPQAGHVDFNEENAGEVQPAGPPPPVKHPPMLDCKYTRSCAAAGPAIADPLAMYANVPLPHPRSQWQLRAGMVAGDGGFGPALALAWVHAFGADPMHPWLMYSRAEWNLRGGDHHLGGSYALGKVIAAPDAAFLDLAAGVGYASFDGAKAIALADLAIRGIPVVLGARYEQSMERLATRALIVELGIAWRRY